MLVMLFGMSRVIYAKTYASGSIVSFYDLEVNDILENDVNILDDIGGGPIFINDVSQGDSYTTSGSQIVRGVTVSTQYGHTCHITLEPYPAPSTSESADSAESTEKEIPAWKPTTPEDIERFSYVSGSEPEVTVGDGTLVIENSVQGPACMESMKAALPEGYEIGHTYNIYPYGLVMEDATERYHSKESITFTMKIPADLAKEGRTFMFLCISEDGKPFLFENASENADEITITTKRFYAYALIYTDSAN